ncbi:MAG: RecX family transcriptional regulator [Alicyclobacillaceae bacterium]|nr:RecX family transcriptional regulator [Alicyclobacillaceae bacterium]
MTNEGDAWRLALTYLARRPRTESELRRYLTEIGVPEESVERVVSRCGERGWIDDREYARRWMERRVGGGATSLREAAAELRKRGVEREIVEEAVTAFSEDEEEAARNWARRHRRRHRELPLSEWRIRAYRALMRKGFSPEAALRVLSGWSDPDLPNG